MPQITRQIQVLRHEGDFLGQCGETLYAKCFEYGIIRLGEKTMSPAVKDVIARIKAMRPGERKALIRGMIIEKVLSEDEEDMLASESRKHESATSAEEFFSRLSEKKSKNC